MASISTSKPIQNVKQRLTAKSWKIKGITSSRGKSPDLHRAPLEGENRSTSPKTLTLYRVPRRVRAALLMLNPGQRRADRAGDRSPGPAPQSPAGGTALKGSPLPSPPPPWEVPPDLSLSTTGPVSPQPAGAPSPGRATHGLLPLIVRRSPLRSRTLECSPADAISRTCSTTLIPVAENRGAEGTDGKETDNAAARRHSKMAPPGGPRAPPPAGARDTAFMADERPDRREEGQPGSVRAAPGPRQPRACAASGRERRCWALREPARR